MKITDGLHVIAHTITAPTLTTKSESVNHLFVADCSGSMYGLIDQVVADVKAKLRTLKKGDSVSLAWFSGKGEYRWVLKGFTVDGNFGPVDTALDDFRARGLTCFSEVLTEAVSVVDDLKGFKGPFALCFLTDGYPTVSPAEKEAAATIAALRSLGKHVASSLFVGYGPYYNKATLTQMAAEVGGTVIHAQKFQDFPPEYGLFMERSRTAVPMQELNFKFPAADVLAIITVDGGAVSTHAFDSLKSGIGVKVPENAKEVVLVLKTGESKSKDPVDDRSLYAAALVLSQQARADLALEVLGHLCDKMAIDLLANAFTNAEYGTAEHVILGAVRDEKKRRVGGPAPKKYLPKKNAFCLLDLVDALVDDPDAAFLPKHDAFDYRRIGPPTKVRDGYPKFVPLSDDIRTPFADLTFHDSILNLSVRTKIGGHIVLPDSVPADRSKAESKDNTIKRPSTLGPQHATFQWRNYALVRGGARNLDSIPVVLGKPSFAACVVEGLIPKGTTFFPGNVYVLDLTKLPVMNRAMAETCATDPGDVARLVVDELFAEGELKAAKARFEKAFPKAGRTFDKRTPEETAFLAACGIRPDGSYGPPVDEGATTDYFMAPSLELKVKGCSSLPSVADVEKNIAAGKPLTLAQAFVANGLNLIDTVSPFNAAGFEGYIDSVKRDLKVTRRKLQRTKFAVLLGKRWFDGWISREGCKATHPNVFAPGAKSFKVAKQLDAEVSFVLGEEKVEF